MLVAGRNEQSDRRTVGEPSSLERVTTSQVPSGDCGRCGGRGQEGNCNHLRTPEPRAMQKSHMQSARRWRGKGLRQRGSGHRLGIDCGGQGTEIPFHPRRLAPWLGCEPNLCAETHVCHQQR